MGMNISNVEYHMRMMQDIAKQKKGCLVALYANEDTGTCATSLVGNAIDISAGLLMIIDKICEKQPFTPAEYCEMLMRMTSGEKMDNDDIEEEK